MSQGGQLLTSQQTDEIIEEFPKPSGVGKTAIDVAHNTNNLKENLKIKLLTSQQIDEIIGEFPKPPGVGKTAIDVAHKHNTNNLKEHLKTIKLINNRQAFLDFKEEVIYQAYSGHIEMGRALGVTAGISLGGPVTQLSLSSFQLAGSESGVSLAFQHIRDFLNGSKANRRPQMKLYFKKPYTGTDLNDVVHEGDFDFILAKRHEFEQTLVADVIESTQILNMDDAEQLNIFKIIELHSKIRPNRFDQITDQFKLTYSIRLNLNRYRMHTHKITMGMLARAIEGPDQPENHTCIWRSQLEGVMYIIVDETKNYATSYQDNNTGILAYLDEYILKKINVWLIKGIPGILSLLPIKLNVIDGIFREEKIDDNHVNVYTNNYKTRWDGVSLGDIKNVLEKGGYEVTGVNPTELSVTVKSKKLIMEKLKQKISKLLDTNGRLISNHTPEEGDLYNASRFYYGQSNGTNMNEIIWRDDLDLYRCVSNYSYEIYSTLGIDAARMFLVFKFKQTMYDYNIYVNNRHISLIFDTLTNLGTINSLSFTGINRRKTGALTLMSYERAFDVLIGAGLMGEMEGTDGISEAIYMGKRSNIMGTSAPDVQYIIPTVSDQVVKPSLDDTIPWGVIDTDKVISSYKFDDMGVIFPTKSSPQTSVGPVPDAVIVTGMDDIILPTGAKLVMASTMGAEVLSKTLIGTNLKVTTPNPFPQPKADPPVINYDLPDITQIDNIIGLALLKPGNVSINVPVFTSKRTIMSNQPISAKPVGSVGLPKPSLPSLPLPHPKVNPIPSKPKIPVTSLKLPAISEIQKKVSDRVKRIAPELSVYPKPIKTVPKDPIPILAEVNKADPYGILDLIPTKEELKKMQSGNKVVKMIDTQNLTKLTSEYKKSLES